MSATSNVAIDSGSTDMVATKKKEPLRVKWNDGQVVIEPKDNDIFAVTAQQAIEGCRWQTKVQEVGDRFKEEIIERIHKWCVDHDSLVRYCYSAFVGGEGLAVYVVGQSNNYDFGLGDEMASLQSTLHNAGWLIQVLQIPVDNKEDLESFFSIDEAIEIYAKAEAAPGQSRQEQKVS